MYTGWVRYNKMCKLIHLLCPGQITVIYRLVPTRGRLSISRCSCTVCLRNKQAINMSFTSFMSTEGWPTQCAHRGTDKRSPWWSNRFHMHRILTEIISCRVKSITQDAQHTALVSAVECTA